MTVRAPDGSAGGVVPKYEVLREHLRHDIQAGMQPHDALPSERELMARYDVSRMTVREALTRLADEGLVYRVQGSGTFVADPDTITKSLSLTSFSEDIQARRMVPGSRPVLAENIEADVNVAHDLALSPGAPVLHLERVRTADDVPMCLENVWLPLAIVGDGIDLETPDSLYERLEAIGAGPERADQTIRATVVDSRVAKLLGVPAHSPALLVSRVTYDGQGRAVERGNSVYRADRYDFKVSVSRRRRS
jgi:GntR family transcriptional regulator